MSRVVIPSIAFGPTEVRFEAAIIAEFYHRTVGELMNALLSLITIENQ